MIYLACPYSHPDPAVRQFRFERVTLATTRFVLDGKLVFSPITHSHPLVSLGARVPGDWEYWSKFDKRILSICHTLTVLCLDGWKDSTGVRCEIGFAMELGIPITYMDDVL